MKTQLQLAQGAIRDQIRQELYDTLTIAATVSPIATRLFFTNIQGKPKYETNLRINRQLEGDVSFRIEALKVEAQNFYFANAAALPLIQEHSSMKLDIGEKAYWEGPMRSLVGGLNHNVSVIAAEVTGSNVYQQYAAPREFGILFKKGETLDIKPNQTFSVEWRCEGMTAAEIVLATPAAATKINFVFFLKGLQRRPVQ